MVKLLVFIDIIDFKKFLINQILNLKECFQKISSEWEFYVLIVFLFTFLIQLTYYFIFKKCIKNARKQISAKVEKYNPVSVIICAKNEAENLKNNLPYILEQEYPDFEVIVVNDCSQDNTEEVLINLMKKYKNLRYTNIHEDKKFTHTKKLAILVGIKSAKNDILLFTDADCKPISKDWIKRMQSHFDEKTQIVLGYGGYFEENSLLNKYIRYDTMIIALQYFSYYLIGVPYMGVGRNLAYRRSFFFTSKGFSSHYHLSSGDDDLFVNENATRENTDIEYHLKSHTRSIPEQTFKQWIRKKRRHFTTSKLYKFKHKFLLSTDYISKLLFYVLFVYLIVSNFAVEIVLSIFVLRFLLNLILMKKVMRILNEKNFWLLTPFFEIFSLILNIIILLQSRIRYKTIAWK